MKFSPSHRPERVADLILRELSELLIVEIRDVHLRRVTLTQVRMTADLKEARVYYDFEGTSRERQEVERTLKKASGFMRGALAKRLSLRSIPALKFHFDETRELFTQADKILHDLEQK